MVIAGFGVAGLSTGNDWAHKYRLKASTDGLRMEDLSFSSLVQENTIPRGLTTPILLIKN